MRAKYRLKTSEERVHAAIKNFKIHQNISNYMVNKNVLKRETFMMKPEQKCRIVLP